MGILQTVLCRKRIVTTKANLSQSQRCAFLGEIIWLTTVVQLAPAVRQTTSCPSH